MKKLTILIALLSTSLFFGCKKDGANKAVDTTPKMVEVTFTNNHIQSSTYFTINERTTSVYGVNGSFESVKDNVQVKIGDTLTAHMFSGKTATSNYSIKMAYGDKELAFSDNVIADNDTHKIDLTHVFTEVDFK